MLVSAQLVIMAQLQMLYSEWLDQDRDARIQNKSPVTIFSLASLDVIIEPKTVFLFQDI